MTLRWYVYPLLGAALGGAVVAMYMKQPEENMIARINACAKQESSGTAVSCLRATVLDLLSRYPAAEIMQNISHMDPMPWGCHGIGHIVGQEVYKKDPRIETAIAACGGACGYSCIHGAIGESMLDEYGTGANDVDLAHAPPGELEMLSKKYCTNENESGPACHVVGHLLNIAYGDINETLSACEQVAGKKPSVHLSMCASGAFMQFSGGLRGTLVFGEAPKAIALPHQQDDYMYPCDTVPKKYIRQCILDSYSSQAESMKETGVGNYDALLEQWKNTCETTTLGKEARAACFERLGRYYMNGIGSTGSSAAPKCAVLQGDDRKACLLGVMFWVAGWESVKNFPDICQRSDGDLKDFCYNAAFLWVDKGYNATPKGFDLCASASDKELCTAQKIKYGPIKSTLPDYGLGLYGGRE